MAKFNTNAPYTKLTTDVTEFSDQGWQYQMKEFQRTLKAHIYLI